MWGRPYVVDSPDGTLVQIDIFHGFHGSGCFFGVVTPYFVQLGGHTVTPPFLRDHGVEHFHGALEDHTRPGVPSHGLPSCGSHLPYQQVASLLARTQWSSHTS